MSQTPMLASSFGGLFRDSLRRWEGERESERERGGGRERDGGKYLSFIPKKSLLSSFHHLKSIILHVVITHETSLLIDKNERRSPMVISHHQRSRRPVLNCETRPPVLWVTPFLLCLWTTGSSSSPGQTTGRSHATSSPTPMLALERTEYVAVPIYGPWDDSRGIRPPVSPPQKRGNLRMVHCCGLCNWSDLHNTYRMKNRKFRDIKVKKPNTRHQSILWQIIGKG